MVAGRVRSAAPQHGSPSGSGLPYGSRFPSGSGLPYGRRGARPLPGFPLAVLLALLLALFGGSGALAQQPEAHGAAAQSQSAGGAYEQAPAQHLNAALAHPAHAATHAPLPLAPAVGKYVQEPRHSVVLPRRPALSAAHLTHRSPRHGRAPPAAQAPQL
ncbi:hypothetical protein [Streptomyces sp. Amel2xB2]|uniref:hypothetical protein n=1 Tax=Streptomyces sp. Amel2xB2 TaxID=1305829 RepID=UPI000DBA3F14|nr:hypothetical protein [Streptomyces sp. Amel2xB2]